VGGGWIRNTVPGYTGSRGEGTKNTVFEKIKKKRKDREKAGKRGWAGRDPTGPKHHAKKKVKYKTKTRAGGGQPGAQPPKKATEEYEIRLLIPLGAGILLWGVSRESKNAIRRKRRKAITIR